MRETFEFVGTVRDGIGGAARDTARGIYLPEMLGFTPYQGSLNLDVTADVLPDLFRYRYDFAVHYAGTHRPMWQATTDDGEPCMVQWHSGMPANVLEVFSPHHLRSRFGLTNGSPVRIRLAAVAER